MDGGQAVAFGQQRQAFQDGILSMVPTIEDGSDRFDTGVAAGPALIALSTSLGAAKAADVATIDTTIDGTVWIPAKGARMDQVRLFHDRPPHVDALVMIHQHEE